MVLDPTCPLGWRRSRTTREPHDCRHLSARRPRRHRGSPRREVRRDIEGLRALAVGLVVVYHLWPGVLPGGFVGVDVFLVVSGFLVTTHLLDHPPRRPNDVVDFWGRRIRRLLPASFLVLLVTLGLSWAFAPVTQWAETGRQIVASTFYVENWALAKSSVDYLAADNAPSPVQHFWSLGVEEQFYVMWPVLIVVLAWAARRAAQGADDRSRVLITAGLGVVVLASFAWSLHLTASDSARAYFEMPTRVWELGAGALLAGVAPAVARALGDRTVLRATIAWTGVITIGVGALLLDGATPFPGTAALWPVLGTLAVIAAHAKGPASPYPILALRPVQYVGSISYSVYLWHWPLIVLFPYVVGRERNLLGSLVVVVATLVLAGLTKAFVEDRLRGSYPLGVPLWRTYAFMVVGMGVLVLAVLAVRFDYLAAKAEGRDRLAAAVAAADPCFGAAALVTDGCDPHGAELHLEPVTAAEDQPAPYRDDCWVLGSFTRHRVCTYGSDAPGAREVALVGNSHAGHWLPALQAIAETDNLRITTYLISICHTVPVPIQFDEPGRSDACLAWNERVLTETSEPGRFDLVVTSNLTARDLDGVPGAEQAAAVEAAYAESLDRWVAGGVPVVVIRDTPDAGTDLQNVPDCVAWKADDLAACDGDLGRVPDDPLAAAADAHPSDLVSVADLTDLICRDETCYSTVGGLVVYFEAGHLSETFARSTAPYLRPALVEAMEG